MPKTFPPLATADEIRSIAERAFAHITLLTAPSRNEDDEDDFDYDEWLEKGKPQLRGALEALRFCAAAAGILRDPGLLPLILRILPLLVKWQEDYSDDKEPVFKGLTLLLRAGAPADSDIETLARNRDPKVRAAVAEGLLPRSPRALALLEKLSRDPEARVRNPAKKTLSNAREVPWWFGKFQQDPLARLDAAEASKHKQTLEKISALLDNPYGRPDTKLNELAGLAVPLPDPIVVDLCETTLSASMFNLHWAPSLGTLLICREGGTDALLRLCKTWSRNRELAGMGSEARFIIDAPTDVRLSVCDALIRFAVAEPQKARLNMHSAARTAACLAGHAYPPGVDLGPIVDILLELPEPADRRMDWVINELAGILRADGADPSTILDRLLEARIQGYPGPWKRLALMMDKLLAKAPKAAQRKLAEDAIGRDDESTVIWGIKKLLLEVHDPGSDIEPLEMASRFFAEPRYRALMWKDNDLRTTIVSELRALLRADKLGFEEATLTVNTIQRLWYIPDATSPGRFAKSPEEAEAARLAERARFEAFLGPEAFHGPVTEAEWSALRRVRSRERLDTTDLLNHAIGAVPPGPIRAEDRAIFERAVEHCEEHEPIFAIPLAMALRAHATEADLPLFDRLIARCPEERNFLRSYLRDTREALGLPLTPHTRTDELDEEEEDQ